MTARQKRNRKQDDAGAVAGRLGQLADQHTLSVIAQRTGTPITNVHRYLRGAKVPADFCARLVREFSVNPAWLLNGEGASNLADVAEGTRRMAGDLLELVEAMNAVTHMRLGALTGKHHLRVLRELNEALVRYEELRGRLNAHAMPIFRQLAGDAQRALNKLDVERAGELLQAADQVVRLCQNEQADSMHLAMKSHFAYLSRDRAEALRLQQRLFRNPLSQGRLAGDEACEQATRLLITLNESGREEEALRLGEAALILGRGERGPAFAMLAMMTGNVMINTGRLFEGLALIQRWVPRVPDEGRRRAGRHMQMMGLIYAKTIRPDQAFNYGDHYDVKAFDLLNLAALLEDPELLEQALAYRADPRVERAAVYRPFDFFTDCAAALLQALKGNAKQADAAVRMLHESWGKSDEGQAEIAITATQVHRLLGRNARREHATAQELIAGSSNRRIGLLSRMIHNHNALQIKGVPPDEKRKAAAEIEHFTQSGYDLFAT